MELVSMKNAVRSRVGILAILSTAGGIALGAAAAASATEKAEPPPSRVLGPLGLQFMSIEGRRIGYYMAKPEGEGTWPAVVLAHEGWGIDRQFRERADKLAAEGFIVMVPDLNGGKVAADADKARELGVLMDEADAVARLDAVARYLKFLPEVGDHRVGLVGFDVGGRLALLTGMICPDVSAVVNAYGRPVTDEDSLRRIGPPILGIFGDQDTMIPIKDVEEFRAALAAAGRTAEVKVYQGAGRAFMNENAGHHDADASRDAWSLILSFLRSHL